MRVGTVLRNICMYVLPMPWLSKLEIAQVVVACCLIIVEFCTAVVYDRQTKGDFSCNFQELNLTNLTADITANLTDYCWAQHKDFLDREEWNPYWAFTGTWIASYVTFWVLFWAYIKSNGDQLDKIVSSVQKPQNTDEAASILPKVISEYDDEGKHFYYFHSLQTGFRFLLIVAVLTVRVVIFKFGNVESCNTGNQEARCIIENLKPAFIVLYVLNSILVLLIFLQLIFNLEFWCWIKKDSRARKPFLDLLWFAYNCRNICQSSFLEKISAPSRSPKNVRAISESSTSLQVSWEPARGNVTGYRVYYQAEEGAFKNGVERCVEIEDCSCSRINLTLLEEYVLYSIRVLAFNSIGKGPRSAAVFVRTLEAAPSSAPENVQAQAISSTCIKVTWEEVRRSDQNGDITGYTVFYHAKKDGSENDEEQQKIVSDGKATATELSSLEEYVEYSIKVLASNKAGDGPKSAAVFKWTREGIPGSAPTEVKAQSIGPTSIRVHWQSLVKSDWHGAAPGYRIYYEAEEGGIRRGGEHPVNVNKSSSTVVDISSLDERVRYNVRVVAFNGSGEGPSSDPVHAVTGSAIPSAPPQNVRTQATGPHSVRIAWEPVPKPDRNGVITGYNIYYQASEEEFKTDTERFRDVHDGSSLEANVEGLKPNVLYNFTVSARNSFGSGPRSVPVPAKTKEKAPSSAPENVQAQAISPTSIRVTWEAVRRSDQNGDITGYTVCYQAIKGGCKNDDKQQKDLSDGKATSTELSSLEEYVEYSIKVLASNRAGKGPKSTAVYKRTHEAKPGSSPCEVRAHSTSATTIQVLWRKIHETDVNGAWLRYRVFYQAEGGDEQSEVFEDCSSASLSNLKKYVSYDISVLAFNGVGCGPRSNVVSEKTNEAAPSAAPQNVKSETIGETSIRVTWEAVPDADHNGIITGYKIFCQAMNEDGQQIGEESSYDENDAAASLKDLVLMQSCSEYRVSVQAFTSAGGGPRSVPVTVWTACPIK